MENKFEKEAEESLNYLKMKIKLALTVLAKHKYGESLVSRIVPMLIYKEKLEEAITVYRKRQYPKPA